MSLKYACEKTYACSYSKGNRTGNYGVPKVDEKRLKTDMVPYASAVGSSIYYPDTVHVYIWVVLAMSSP